MPFTFPAIMNTAHSCGPVDEELAKAVRACEDTDSILPILKEELKCTIQKRRLAEGKTELTVQFTPPTKQELSPEEIIKKENRREQNRRAARKFRRKQAELARGFQQRIKQLETENVRLREQLRRLTQEKGYIQGKVHAHHAMCENSGVPDVSMLLPSQ
ncbi:cyclic AMP-dependent transcription factor ATF-3-like [Pecten maximus]|uniref:cyclic AMP-dependent transcription factor ATF-3-like n=1 Tax=Pecten maximus TaxID=6579 RepID=UPI001458FCDA|nr:cyclic AMP-dependent transcription factor ATF-3-like [Pecten maximus]